MLLFKVGTVARYLNVHRNTVTNWINSGKLPASPSAAKRYAISVKEFIRFCEDKHIPAQAMEQVIAETRVQDSPPDDNPQAPIIGGLSPARKKRTPRKVPQDKWTGSVMVVGGGIAGLQSALELADSGFFVYIVEKSSGIGGVMPQLDKTFPTNDCASCIVLPKLVECDRHLNIEILTQSQVSAVKGNVGRFQISVEKKPRYIDEDKCIACGICSEKCPIVLPDDFNFGISRKRAIHIKYDQSIPLKYTIDPEACLFFTHGKCRACEKFCPTGAINFSQKTQMLDLTVGAVILAPGFKPFDPRGHDFFGYDLSDVVTSLEYERMLSISGPNRGRLLRPSDRTEPQKIAWLLCVGSRNQNNCGNSYCSNICCLASVKQSMATAEQRTHQQIERKIFFTDLRSQGKESEKYFERAKQDNVQFVRALPHTMEPGEDGTGVRMRYMTEQGESVHESFDLVVLSIGFEAPEDAEDFSRLFDIELDRHCFAATSCFEPVETSRPGVFAIGAFQMPKTISRSVTQSAAAAASAARLLAGQRGTLTRSKHYPEEKVIDPKKPAVGVFVCSCGINIAGTIDVEQVVEEARELNHVVYVENNLFSCSADAQKRITAKIEEYGLDRIVIAACTPRTHEPLFQETLKNARLNGFMVEMANIRNQNSWVHQQDRESATIKARDQVRMAVAKVVHNYPLKQDPIKVNRSALVVGGGIVGLDCVLTLAKLGIKSILVERSDTLGGNAQKLSNSFRGEHIPTRLEKMIADVRENRYIKVYTETTLEAASGSVGNFKGLIRQGNRAIQIEFGAAVMATGGREAVPDEYLYGAAPSVMTQLEFDRRVLFSPDTVRQARAVVFIQCVGSREPRRPYCSRICCIHSVKSAIQLKEINPKLKVFILYREVRTYGEWEERYKDAREAGVQFIRYESWRKPVVAQRGDLLEIDVFDPISRRPVRITADYLSLATGVVPEDNSRLADLFKFNINSDGFFNGAHPKLKPVDLSVAGLFLAGICNYPKPVDESIEEARAAAFRVSSLLFKEEIQSEAIKAVVTPHCDGCALCVDVCPFHAISMVQVEGSGGTVLNRVTADPALCQGCGLCAATCPQGGIMVHGFTMEQLMAQVRAAVDPNKRRLARLSVPDQGRGDKS